MTFHHANEFKSRTEPLLLLTRQQALQIARTPRGLQRERPIDIHKQSGVDLEFLQGGFLFCPVFASSIQCPFIHVGQHDKADRRDDISEAIAKPMSKFKSLWIIPELSEETFVRMNRNRCLINRWRLLVINGYRLHHVAGVR